jgi:hypothetical protein
LSFAALYTLCTTAPLLQGTWPYVDYPVGVEIGTFELGSTMAWAATPVQPSSIYAPPQVTAVVEGTVPPSAGDYTINYTDAHGVAATCPVVLDPDYELPSFDLGRVRHITGITHNSGASDVVVTFISLGDV